jgi:hypothetical protein
MPSYFIQKGQQIRWYNADDINHKKIISHTPEDFTLAVEDESIELLLETR